MCYKESVTMVGAFPPPIHGLSTTNMSVRGDLAERGFSVAVIDIAADGLGRSLYSRIGRLPRVIAGWVKVLTHSGKRGNALYISVSGGWGQLYEIVFVTLARSIGMRVVLHHHSFAYLNRRSICTVVLCVAAGSRALHVCLSPNMSSMLRQRYKVSRAISVSNAGFVERCPQVARSRYQLVTIGFIGNISFEKGINDFLEVMKGAEELGICVEGVIAGPFQDADVEAAVLGRLKLLKNVKYIGPKYGAGKAEFFNSIDLLVFPTRYQNEAEPFVIHEALAHGVPVIAYGRGCIPELCRAELGAISVAIDKSFADTALQYVRRWVSDPGSFRIISETAAVTSIQRFAQSRSNWEKVVAELAGWKPESGGAREL